MQPWAQDTERRETKLKQCLFLIRHIVKSSKNFVGDKGNKEIYVKGKRSIAIGEIVIS